MNETLQEEEQAWVHNYVTTREGLPGDRGRWAWHTRPRLVEMSGRKRTSINSIKVEGEIIALEKRCNREEVKDVLKDTDVIFGGRNDFDGEGVIFHRDFGDHTTGVDVNRGKIDHLQLLNLLQIKQKRMENKTLLVNAVCYVFGRCSTIFTIKSYFKSYLLKYT